MRKFLNEIKGINIVDIGSSGRLDLKWKLLERYINLTGFDPNKAECKRMSKAFHLFISARYLPYAIGSVNGRSNSGGTILNYIK